MVEVHFDYSDPLLASCANLKVQLSFVNWHVVFVYADYRI